MRFASINLVLSLAGCAYVAPLSPTSPTAVAIAPAIVALELAAVGEPDFLTGTMQIGVRTRDASGQLAAADVSCVTSAGHVLPARFNTRTVVALELQAQTRARLSCSSGELVDAIDVDLSAWIVDLNANQYVSLGDGAGESRIHVAPRQRIAGVTPTRVTLDWGDGAVEILPYVPASTTGTRFHRYRAPGHYVVTGRIEWPGGAYERRLTVFGGPPGSDPSVP